MKLTQAVVVGGGLAGGIFLALAAGGHSVALANDNTISYECVTRYDGSLGGRVCPGFVNINNACQDARGFRTGMLAVPGVMDVGSFEENAVFDTDTIESDGLGGADNSFTDRSNSGVVYWSMHGATGSYPMGGFCTSNANCTNARCFTMNGANRCVGFRTGQMKTCSTGDAMSGLVNLATDVRLGESTFSGGWGGVGTNGNVNIAIFAISAPLLMHWEVASAANMFAGIHMIGGYSQYLAPWPSTAMGDMTDVPNRGSKYATRLKNGNALGPAHVDTTRLDLPTSMSAPSCTLAISCATSEARALWHLYSETWPTTDSQDEVSAPSWCSWTFWCRF